METETCINCGNEVIDKFCAHCGQRTNVKRITFKEGWGDFWSRVYGFDGMFPRTLRDLTLRPGEAARKFISGNRAQYYGPVGYFFLMVTLFLVIAGLLGIDIKEFLNANQQRLVKTPDEGSGEARLNQMIMEFISENMRLIAFMVIPFNAISARFILFRKSGLNFLENMVLPFYLIGHVYWITIASLVIYKISGSTLFLNLISLITVIYFGYGYSNFMQYQSKLKSFVKGIFVYLIGFLLYMIVISMLMVLVIIILYYFNPEMFEAIRPSHTPK